ncbi:FMN-binding negative transcriptional regulator [Phaeacidiphilus oryzae]|jgi:transcriptional regulator|uniref:FMN-binding negative transcriptional regulator n=1 Tax=Phaeacidiphilus oryzae TaxID=348818 RepID=UPI00056C63DC|nr:FMN-binding negative transcriptional regulator [Phaeacidiphilus oryzae]
MYIPRHFLPEEADVQELLAAVGSADLVTMTGRGLMATQLPWVYDPDAGERGALLGHLARANEQWSEPVTGEAMVIVRGSEAYISPNWYASKAEHHRVVPTWNYLTAHVYGRLVVHDDPEWLAGQVSRLTDRHEAESARPGERPWAVADAPEKYLAGQLRAIVGVELAISRVEAKFKLSQNRPAADVAGVAAGLDARGRAGDAAVAAAVRRHDPHQR